MRGGVIQLNHYGECRFSGYFFFFGGGGGHHKTGLFLVFIFSIYRDNFCVLPIFFWGEVSRSFNAMRVWIRYND